MVSRGFLAGALVLSTAVNAGVGAYLLLRPKEAPPPSDVQELLDRLAEIRRDVESLHAARDARSASPPGLAAAPVGRPRPSAAEGDPPPAGTPGAAGGPAAGVVSGAAPSSPPATAAASGGGPSGEPAGGATSSGAAPRSRPGTDATPRPAPDANAGAAPGGDPSRARMVAEGAKAKVLQIQDARQRDEGFEELAALLRPGSDEASVAAGLRTLIEVRAVEYDRERFRELILPYARDGSPEIRVQALYALFNVKRVPEDVRLAIDLAGIAQGEIRMSAAVLLVFFSDYKVLGDVARAFAPLLEGDPDPGGRRSLTTTVANALRGAEAETAIQERVAELWRNRGPQDGLLDYVISQMLRKDVALVSACLDLLAGEGSHRQLADGRLRAGRDVAESARRALADGAAARLEKAADPWVQTKLLEILAEHGTTAQADVVRAFSVNSLVAASVRQKAGETWKVLSARSTLEPGR